MIVQYHIMISGHVQGIFFRAFVQSHAKSLNLKGYVKNLPTGEVEMQVVGEEKNIEELLRICKIQHPLAQIENIVVKKGKPTDQFDGFEVL